MERTVNEYTVSWELYLKWVFEAKKEGKRLAFTVLYVVLAIAGIVKQFWILALFCVYMAAVRDYVWAKQNYKKVLAMHGGKEWKRSITVTAEEITVNDCNSEIKIETSRVAKVTQSDEKIRIFLKDYGSLRLYKDSFTEGSREDCLKILGM